MDAQVGWTLIACGAAVPYVVEVSSQVPLLARVMAALPDDVRDSLPPHPRRPAWAMFGSTRFFLALLRWARRDQAGDGKLVARLKRKVRASLLREALFAAGLVVVVVVAWRHGWRPARLIFDD
jgi:hypothetical protein